MRIILAISLAFLLAACAGDQEARNAPLHVKAKPHHHHFVQQRPDAPPYYKCNPPGAWNDPACPERKDVNEAAAPPSASSPPAVASTPAATETKRPSRWSRIKTWTRVKVRKVLHLKDQNP